MSASGTGTNLETTPRFKDLKWYVRLLLVLALVLTPLAMIEMVYFAFTGIYFLPGAPPPSSMFFGIAMFVTFTGTLLLPSQETGTTRVLSYFYQGFFALMGLSIFLLNLASM